jgi:cardiolipin synthase
VGDLLPILRDVPAWAAELGFVAYVILVTGVLVLERRRPTSTMAWILALVFLPVLGLGLYLLLGRIRVRRRRRRRARRPDNPVDSTRHMASVSDIPQDLPRSVRGLVQLALETAAAPLRRADRVDILPTGEQAFAALRQAIERAQRYIHMEFYIWRDDEAGRAVTGLLTERARAGVNVRVLYDHLGSLGLPTAHFDELRAAGGEVAVFGRLRFMPRFAMSRVNFRNHRKIVAIDDHVGFVGGLNIGNKYLHADDRTRWRDLQIQVSGDALMGLEAVFLDDWLATTGQAVTMDGTHPAVASTGPLLQVVASGPDTRVADAIATQFTAAISSAQQRAWIATPYFVPDESLAVILRTAALRGVDVRILVPNGQHTDQPLVAAASRSYYDNLLAAGCKIYEYTSGMLHAKYLIIDDKVCAVGSANMDVRSFHINYEITAMIYDSGTTARLAAVFEEDLTGAHEVTLQDRQPQPLTGRLTEGFARLLSPLL